MTLKYQSELHSMPHDLSEFVELENRTAFRWVFEDSSDVRNFTPIYADRARFEYEKKRDKLDFKGWALSFHESLKQSKDSLLHLTDGKPNLFKKLGTCIACGLIQKADGIAEIKADNYGHFNHFEYVGVDFSDSRFEVVDVIFVG